MAQAAGSLGEFLKARRATLTPGDVGISSFGARRVPGLRREELAQLAGVSPAYLTRLEQGQSTNASEQVVDALARALRLDEDERAHLHALARPKPSRAKAPAKVRPNVVTLLDALTVPAVAVGPRSEVLAWNRLGHLLLAGHLDPADRPNLTRLLFLDPHTRDLYREWPVEARLAVASLRYLAAEQGPDKKLEALVGELSVASPEFAALWARHPVQRCTSGVKHLQHPTIGAVDLPFEVLHVPGADGQRLITYPAEPGTPAAAAVSLL